MRPCRRRGVQRGRRVPRDSCSRDGTPYGCSIDYVDLVDLVDHADERAA